MKHWYRGITAATLFATASVARAHIIDATGAGFAAGALHPFSGFDHLLAMIAVGVWAGQMDGRALWRLPVTFVSVMLIGGALGLSGIPLAHIEAGIAASLVALGLLIATSARLPLVASMSMVGMFAIFHGHAHGTEIPLAASPALYALGFVTATGALHVVGIALGYFARGWNARVVRVGGLAVLAAGTWLLGST